MASRSKKPVVLPCSLGPYRERTSPRIDTPQYRTFQRETAVPKHPPVATRCDDYLAAAPRHDRAWADWDGIGGLFVKSYRASEASKRKPHLAWCASHHPVFDLADLFDPELDEVAGFEEL